ncbi:MAG: RNA 3'-terminal phosphate cyclase [Planctomycetota bacterium]
MRVEQLAPTVGRYLADQLLIPLALAGGSFTSAILDAHAETNATVIRQMLGIAIDQVCDGKIVRFSCPEPWS